MVNNMIKYTVQVDGDRTEWFLYGQRHREDGPAVERADGYKAWWLNDQIHRVDGPAIERPNGDKEWYLNGYLHREDGPAIEWANGEKQWRLHGQRLSEEEFNKRTKTKELTVNEIEKLLGYKIKVVGG